MSHLSFLDELPGEIKFTRESDPHTGQEIISCAEANYIFEKGEQGFELTRAAWHIFNCQRVHCSCCKNKAKVNEALENYNRQRIQ